MELADQAWKQLQDKEWESAAKTYAAIVGENPYHAAHWHYYGYALYQSKRYEEAIRAWGKTAELGFAMDLRWAKGRTVFTQKDGKLHVDLPDFVGDKAWLSGGRGNPMPWYNIARARAQLGRNDKALDALERAFEEGYNDNGFTGQGLQNDNDLATLRTEPRYRKLVGIPPEGMSREEKWRFDLDFLSRRMEQVHYNLYGKVSRQQFRDSIEKLKDRLPDLKDHQVIVEIRRIVALVGDGHTSLNLPADGPYAMPGLPIEFYLYADGLFVRRAVKDYAEAVGGRVVRIGERTAAEALKAVAPLCSIDNAMGAKAQAPWLLANPHVLEALGVVKDMNRVPLVVEKAGQQIKVDLVPVKRKVTAQDVQAINAGAKAPLPLYLRDRERYFWFEHLPDAKLVYFQFNTVSDTADESLADFLRRMMTFIEANKVENLVIDVRFNPGGNGARNVALLRELIRNDSVNRKGHLFVITGRSTFSAAVLLLSDLEWRTEALFVGEPPASRPNVVGESNRLTLPCSGLRVGCSSLYHQASPLSSDRRPWIAPDIVAELTSADEAANRDPALKAVLDEIARRSARNGPEDKKR
jgi:tetratricopeptide (TPR) repeat protein